MTTKENDKVKNDLVGDVELAKEDVQVKQINNGHTIQLNPTGKQFLTCRLKDSYGF